MAQIVLALRELDPADLAALSRSVDDELRRRGVRSARDDDDARTQRFLDAIIENIPDMIFVKDAERLAFERFNRAGELLLGTSRHDLLGKNDYDFFPADQAEFFQAKDRATLEGKTLVDIPEEPIETKHGLRWLHTKKVPILDQHGVPRHLLGISQDITEHKAALLALVHAKEAAEAASKELESFSYSVAHDLRAPLRAIDGFSQALMEDSADRLDEDERGYLQRVRESAQQMAQLIDDLLNLSRMTRSELRREQVDVSALATATLQRLAQAQPERHVRVTVAPGLTANADTRLLAVVLDNLLGNAWKFSRAKADAQIEVGADASGGRQAFFVRDNGAGFDMAYEKKLFGVFQRLHTVAEFEGTGIGLATTQRIVQRHGGRIWAHGEVDKGATFHFTLGEDEP